MLNKQGEVVSKEGFDFKLTCEILRHPDLFGFTGDWKDMRPFWLIDPTEEERLQVVSPRTSDLDVAYYYLDRMVIASVEAKYAKQTK